MGEPCIHDLDPATCGVCNGADRRAVATARGEMGPWITARFDGRCSCCSRTILQDDDIRSDGEGGWLCDGCGGDE
jgi:hypothetical protein